MMPNGFFYLVIVFICFSCEKNDQLKALTKISGESGISYNESMQKWDELKMVNGNSYRYQTGFQSWAGFGNTTEIEVLAGKVVARSYEEFTIDDQSGEVIIIDSFSENENHLGLHQKGAAPLLIDELYGTCANELLVVDQRKNTLYFETTSNGLMTLCGYVPDDCIDDCFNGIRINTFDWIQ